MMKFSVVTPTYNALGCLKRCVGSVRGQSLSSVQHVVQDALSDDGTPQWLRSQSGLDWRSETDAGMYDAINKGWSRSSGDVLSWLNSDEQYLPGTLSAVADAFESDPQLDLVYGHHIVVDNSGNPLAARRDVPLTSHYVVNGFLYIGSCAMFFHRRLWDQGVLRLDDRLRFASDMDLILRLLRQGVRTRRLDRYLSLFGYDGANLSCSPQMLKETDWVRQQHRGSESAVFRSAVRAARVAQRAWKGGFRHVDLDFEFATSERPDYLRVQAHRVGPSYLTARERT